MTSLDSAPRDSLQHAFHALLRGTRIELAHSDRAVHAVRKSLKRSRAALRLMRCALGDARYRTANAQLRDVARPLTAVRDGVALLKTLDGLMKSKDPRSLRVFAQHVREMLQGRHRTNQQALVSSDLRRAAAQLQRIERATATLNAKVSDARSARREIEKRFCSGRHAFSSARREATSPHWHECRKQAKYLTKAVDLAQRLLVGSTRFGSSPIDHGEGDRSTERGESRRRVCPGPRPRCLSLRRRIRIRKLRRLADQ